MKLVSPGTRIVAGLLGWGVLLFMAIFGLITGKQPDGTIVTTIGGTSTLLLTAGIVKQHKAFKDVQ